MKTKEIYKWLKDSSFRLSTDSRHIAGGEVFFALRGENYDGNKFVPDALEKGARCAVIDNPLFQSSKTILVDNVLEELQAVALSRREILNIPVLAITGSNGKTTTKEILSRILSKRFDIHYTRGNLNNHIGVPVTLLTCPEDAEFMIVEMGANHKGEIKHLCRIAKPDYGLITNIGKAHLEGFGSYQGVIEAKTELYDYLEENNGVVFYNENDEVLHQEVRRRKLTNVTYAKPGKHNVEISGVEQSPELIIQLQLDNQRFTLDTNLFGLHNVENILASLSVGLYFKVVPEKLQTAIESYLPDNNRSQIFKTGKNTLICDSYNANPVSMDSAIESFGQYPGDSKTVILGDMLELGDFRIEEHEKVLRKLSACRDWNILLIGKTFHSLAEKYEFKSFVSRDDLVTYLSENPVRNSLVLIKGSRALGLEKIYGLM
ncbi:MAG: UDP-N-acetylmuramoyl-tripeptide--D-alanyl-D-alanine ligase [Bacteroidales bacterium]|nr:UDP-N-acetylmuramoyl-tripeptide--D-alanyl-D-alanine ligase [Bacteroidales bacterium]